MILLWLLLVLRCMYYHHLLYLVFVVRVYSDCVCYVQYMCMQHIILDPLLQLRVALSTMLRMRESRAAHVHWLLGDVYCISTSGSKAASVIQHEYDCILGDC